MIQQLLSFLFRAGPAVKLDPIHWKQVSSASGFFAPL
jgi:hypothetical protein